jgi:hypothetical protein
VRPIIKVEVISLDKDAVIKKLDELIARLVLDYDRMSTSGQETYNEICRCMEQLIGG